MLDLKNKMTESIEKKLLFLSLGGTVLCFLCISCLFMFTLITTEESLFQGFHLLREGITEEITEHSSRNKAQLYENHVVSVAENMNLNISECMDDVELIAQTLLEHEQITAEEIDYLLEHRHLKKDEVAQESVTEETKPAEDGEGEKGDK